MIFIQGKGVSKGVADGPIYFFQRPNTTITDAPAADIEAEKSRIAAAQEKAAEQLNALAEKAREEAGDETAILFETHAMFVEDDDYVKCMMTALEEKHCTAEKAVEIAGDEFSAMLAAMDDPYMQARAADIKDVTRHILNNLMGVTEGGSVLLKIPPLSCQRRSGYWTISLGVSVSSLQRLPHRGGAVQSV